MPKRYLIPILLAVLLAAVSLSVEGYSESRDLMVLREMEEAERVQILEALKACNENSEVPIPSDLTIFIEVRRDVPGIQVGEWKYWLFTCDGIRVRKSLHNAEIGEGIRQQLTQEEIERSGKDRWVFGDYDHYFRRETSPGRWRALVCSAADYNLFEYEPVFLAGSPVTPTKSYHIQFALGDKYCRTMIYAEGLTWEPTESHSKVVAFIDELLKNASTDLEPVASSDAAETIDREIADIDQLSSKTLKIWYGLSD